MRSIDNKGKRHDWFAWHSVRAWSEKHGCMMNVWLETVSRYNSGYSWCVVWSYEVKE